MAVNAFILMAGLFLMLARTSPALAADNSHGQGKAHDRTSASAVVQRHNDASHSSDHQIGGSGGGDGDKGKTKGGGSNPAPTATSAPPRATMPPVSESGSKATAT
ncbi:MAG: hypothetical protein ACREOY_02405, partial [Candidatus Dormibacteraceae bacterium]